VQTLLSEDNTGIMSVSLQQIEIQACW